jgi:hypothetical protein
MRFYVNSALLSALYHGMVKKTQTTFLQLSSGRIILLIVLTTTTTTTHFTTTTTTTPPSPPAPGTWRAFPFEIVRMFLGSEVFLLESLPC